MGNPPTLRTARFKSRSTGHHEQRTSVRHTVSAVVQVVDAKSGTRLMTRAADLGLGGCYVDTLTPFPAGTEVKLGLHKDNALIELMGKVVYSHPGLGMGIAFVDGAPQHRVALEEWLHSLTQTTYSEVKVAAPPSNMARSGDPNLSAADARGSVARLVNLLLAKGILTDDDAEMILQQRKAVL